MFHYNCTHKCLVEYCMCSWNHLNCKQLQTITFNVISGNPHCTEPWTKRCVMWYELNGHIPDPTGPKQQIIPVLLHQLLQMTCVMVYPYRRR
jgi:hypothetical protein